MAYAEGTSVSAEKSRMEIEQTLLRYGAKAIGYASEEGRAAVVFTMKDRRIRFIVVLPPLADFRRSGRPGVPRTPAQQQNAWEQAGRQRWRALLLVIKAKLEAIASGISCFEDEFLAHIVLPTGQTVGEAIRPQIAESYASGQMPPLLGYSPRPVEISAEATRG